MSLDRWCLGWGRNPHVPDGGLHIATVTPTGHAVTLCTVCLRNWQTDKQTTDG